MSGDSSRRVSGWTHRRNADPRTAEDIVDATLDDGPSASDISSTEGLVRAAEGHRGPSGGAAAASLAGMPADPGRDLQRRFSREPRNRNPQTLPSISGLSSNPPSLPPLRSLYRRTSSTMSIAGSSGNSGRAGRQRPGDAHPEDTRAILSRSGAYPAALSRNYVDPEDIYVEIEPNPGEMELGLGPNSDLHSMLDFSSERLVFPPLNPPAVAPPVRSHEPAEDGRRIKRRKMGSDRFSSSFKGFRYGRYGQVEPGQLTMEIVCCDGGIYSEGSPYAVENILKNDASVYCTKGSRCNIILRHQGATVFSLKELIIKAPGRNSYSAPIREGMVFVSMNKDDLLMRTARYQIQHGGGRGPTTSSLDLGHPPPIVSVVYREDGTVARTQVRQRELYNAVLDPEDEDARATIPPEFTVAPPPFRVTTECSDEEDGFQSTVLRIRRRTPRIGSLPFESDSSDDSDEQYWNPQPRVAETWIQELEMADRERAGRRATDRAQLAAERAQIATERAQLAADRYQHTATERAHRFADMVNQPVAEHGLAGVPGAREAARAAGGELMAPHAVFYIEKNKSKCTIRFDPPVSGRFILLKIWNPDNNSTANIDIKGVVAKGFAGPRYFPSVDLR